MNDNDQKIDLRKINKPTFASKVSKASASVRGFFVKNDTVNRDKAGKFAVNGGLKSRPKLQWSRVMPVVLLFAAIGGFLVFKSSAAVYGVDTQAEAEQFYGINVSRRDAKLASLARKECMDKVAQEWSRTMARANDIFHSDDKSGHLTNIDAIVSRCGYRWSTAGENVGSGPTSTSIFTAFMNSPGHKANILSPKYNVVGIGSWRNSKGKLFITQLFLKII